MDTLLPIDAFAGNRLPVIAQDVDGPINVFDHWAYLQTIKAGKPELPPVTPGNVRKEVQTQHGSRYWIDFNPDVIGALDQLVQERKVVIGWLTTWGPNVRALIEQALDGKLAGGFVLAKQPSKVRGFRPAEWKRTALRTHLSVNPTPWVWIDDEEILIAELDKASFAADALWTTPGFTVSPDPLVGMTSADVKKIAAFAEQV